MSSTDLQLKPHATDVSDIDSDSEDLEDPDTEHTQNLEGPFPFRRLPLDIQLAVFQLIIEQPWSRWFMRKKTCSAFILISRAVYKDFAPFLYQKEILSVTEPYRVLPTFLDTATNLCLQNVRHLFLYTFCYKAWGKDMDEILEVGESIVQIVLPKLPSLKMLEMNFGLKRANFN